MSYVAIAGDPSSKDEDYTLPDNLFDVNVSPSDEGFSAYAAPWAEIHGAVTEDSARKLLAGSITKLIRFVPTDRVRDQGGFFVPVGCGVLLRNWLRSRGIEATASLTSSSPSSHDIIHLDAHYSEAARLVRAEIDRLVQCVT